MGKFKKGVFLGGLLGAGMTWLNTTKKGKEVREDLINQSAFIYEDLKKKVKASKAYDDLTKKDYMVMVRGAVDKYAVKNDAVKKARGAIVSLLASNYDQMKYEFDKKMKKTKRKPAKRKTSTTKKRKTSTTKKRTKSKPKSRTKTKKK
jgi:gas vesicle protein